MREIDCLAAQPTLLSFLLNVLAIALCFLVFSELSAKHHQLLRNRIAEAEAGRSLRFGGHQIHPFHTHYRRGVEQSSITRRPNPWPWRSPATTISQSTARLKPSEVARPKATSRLPRQRLTTASLPASNRLSWAKLRPRAQKAWRSNSRCSLSRAWLGRRFGPRPSQRSLEHRRHGEPAGLGSRLWKSYHFILHPYLSIASDQGARADFRRV